MALDATHVCAGGAGPCYSVNMIDSDYGKVSSKKERRVISFRRGMNSEALLAAVTGIVSDPNFEVLVMDVYRWRPKPVQGQTSPKG